jgi:leucyl aminopeptidase
MQIRLVGSLSERKKADILLVPCYQKEKKPVLAADAAQLRSVLEVPMRLGDFKAKEGELALVYLNELPEPRALLIGLGKEEELSAESCRVGFGLAAKKCSNLQAKAVNLLLPRFSQEQRLAGIRGVAEGLLVANYAFDQLKAESLKEEPTALIEKLTIVDGDPATLKQFQRLDLIAAAVTFARDLVNSNADDLPPQELAARARELGKQRTDLKVTTFDKKRIEKEGMGLLLAVNRGSPRDPSFILVEYTGAPKSKERTVIVGKGITYDTGGLSLKTTANMDTMKTDMAAAAACLATMRAVSDLKLPVNVTAVIPSTENCIGGSSYKVGDVYRSLAGKTVEIKDTDAEGRLILADALAYAVAHLGPTRIIDLATLTGSIVIALGEEVAGLMTTSDELAERLVAAARATGESLWRMPLPKNYKKLLQSEIADLKNIGGRAGGAILAALFLKEFVGDVPWAHLDIAGTAYTDKPLGLHPVRATGYGVRLLVEYLEQL